MKTATFETSRGTIIAELYDDAAPNTVANFEKLANKGYYDQKVKRPFYDGLTFHRVVPNFVIQGGCPLGSGTGGPGYTIKCETGLPSHLRGTVGISTRGRDTGDGQLFVNLIDNWRLDHDYTIIGEVIAGMDVVDGMLEGAIIERVELQ